MKKLRALCAGLMCFSLFCSMIRPLNANAQAFPKKLEKEFREDATLKVRKAVQLYMEAKVEFEKKGAKAFVDKLEALAPKTFTEAEKAFIAKKAARELVLPSLIVSGNRLVGLEGKKVIFNLSTFDVAQGVFSFKEQKLIFNSNKRLIENFESWTHSSKQSFLQSLFVPQAQAKFSKMTGALVGALIGGVLTWFLWPKISQWFKGKKETPIPDNHVSNVAPAATETPAPTATPTPAATPTTAETPPAGRDGKPEGKPPGGSGETNTPAPANAETQQGKPSGEAEKPLNLLSKNPSDEEVLAYISKNHGDQFTLDKAAFIDMQKTSALTTDKLHNAYYSYFTNAVFKQVIADLYKRSMSQEFGTRIMNMLLNHEGKEMRNITDEPDVKASAAEISRLTKKA